MAIKSVIQVPMQLSYDKHNKTIVFYIVLYMCSIATNLQIVVLLEIETELYRSSVNMARSVNSVMFRKFLETWSACIVK